MFARSDERAVKGYSFSAMLESDCVDDFAFRVKKSPDFPVVSSYFLSREANIPLIPSRCGFIERTN